jgi:hypothetical protein
VDCIGLGVAFRLGFSSFLVFGLLALSAPTFASSSVGIVDPQSVFFGYEATLQDRRIESSDDEMTMSTPYKEKKIREFVGALTDSIHQPLVDLDDSQMELDFKPAILVKFEKERFVVNLEPGVIEVNQTPKNIFDIKQAWTPVFKAAQLAGLKASVDKLGEGGGGGHVHVGGRTIKENPFLKNPLLLRNILVYTHQHPSLLFGFAEANDLGRMSTTRTLHDSASQIGFQKAIALFDLWYAQASPDQQKQDSLKSLLTYFRQYAPRFFSHDVFINLQHIENLTKALPKTNNKFTVEWRNIRPLPSAEHVEAIAGLLLKQIEFFSQPEYRVPFQFISAQQFLNFMGPAYTEQDWVLVKQELGIRDPRLDELVYDYTRNKELERDSYYRTGKVSEAYADPEQKHPNREILIPLSQKNNEKKLIPYKNTTVQGNVVELDGKSYLAAVVSKSFAPLRCQSVLLSR